MFGNVNSAPACTPVQVRDVLCLQELAFAPSWLPRTWDMPSIRKGVDG